MAEALSRKEEWRRYGFLPLVAALGYSTSSMHSYGIGAFIEPLEAEFGWSRAQASIGLTVSGLTGAVLSIPVGMLVDKFGPRRIGTVGVVAMIGAFGLLGTATGTIANWILLWTVLAFANLWAGATIWTKAVASRFETSRGLAFAITLTGAPMTATLIPLIATALILSYDWRVGFFGVAIAWAIVVVPSVLLFFRGAHEDPSPPEQAAASQIELPGATTAMALRSSAFYLLILASILFAFTVVGTTVHFMPILADRGADKLAAAGIVSLIGVFSIVGRLGTGLLLDRLPAHLVGAAICLLPVFACLILLLHGGDLVSQSISAMLLGLTVGGEIDVIAYLTTRQFGLRSYGIIFGSMAAGMNLGTATGPLIAGAVYDLNGSYSAFLVITIVAMALSSVILASIRNKPPASPH